MVSEQKAKNTHTFLCSMPIQAIAQKQEQEKIQNIVSFCAYQDIPHTHDEFLFNIVIRTVLRLSRNWWQQNGSTKGVKVKIESPAKKLSI